MNVSKIIMSELNDRMHAFQMLKEELTINGITIASGMDEHGLILKQGIADVAAIFGVDVKFEAGTPFSTHPDKAINRYYISFGDCDISEYRYEEVMPEIEQEEQEREEHSTFETSTLELIRGE